MHVHVSCHMQHLGRQTAEEGHLIQIIYSSLDSGADVDVQDGWLALVAQQVHLQVRAVYLPCLQRCHLQDQMLHWSQDSFTGGGPNVIEQTTFPLLRFEALDTGHAFPKPSWNQGALDRASTQGNRGLAPGTLQKHMTLDQY